MTDALTQPDTPEPQERRSTSWVTDAELIRRSAVPEKIMREALHMFDADPKSGFPRKQKLYGDRRYWPAVELYWAKNNGLISPQDRKTA